MLHTTIVIYWEIFRLNRNTVTKTSHKKFTKLYKVDRGDNYILGIPNKTTLTIVHSKQLDLMNMHLPHTKHPLEATKIHERLLSAVTDVP